MEINISEVIKNGINIRITYITKLIFLTSLTVKCLNTEFMLLTP